MVEKLRFDRRKKAWQARPPESALTEWARKGDDYHAGFLFGLATSGLLSVLIYGVALML